MPWPMLVLFWETRFMASIRLTFGLLSLLSTPIAEAFGVMLRIRLVAWWVALPLLVIYR